MRISNKFALPACLLFMAAGAAMPQDVLTYHNDVARTGQNLNETILTPGNVNSSSFGKLFTIPTDGLVDAQPLYAPKVTAKNGVHNLLIVGTENGTVYAFDADTGAVVWQVSLIGTGESPAVVGCTQITPTIGVTATPVIDRTLGPNGVVYVVGMSQNGSTYYQKLHALDLSTGAELFGGPRNIQASWPGTGDNASGGSVVFNPAEYKERAALLELNGVIYTTWSSHCDDRPYNAWVIGYNASNLTQASVISLTPNGSQGGIWMSGSGPAADSSGNVYLTIGNGDFDTTLNANGFPSGGDYGNAVVKLSTSSGLSVSDYFEEFNQVTENNGDVDLGSGGIVVLPDMTDGNGKVLHLAALAGKDTNIYVVGRDSMGKYNTNSNNIYQEVPSAMPGGMWGTAAYFNGRLYYGANNTPIYAFQFSKAALSTSSVAQTANNFGYPGTTPSISASGTTNAILWAAANTKPAVLHAYDPDTMTELYNSSQAPNGRDNYGTGNRFVVPTIANGKVYIGTTSGVGVFGLLNIAAPQLTPAPGNYSSAQSVTLSDTTTGATIHYTTDGSTPSVSSPTYTGAITVSSTTTINAIAMLGSLTSSVTAGTYTIASQTQNVAAPQMNPAPGTYTAAQSVTLTDATGGATIHYTTDGSIPTAASPVFSTAIPVSSTMTINAIGVVGSATSSVTSGVYTISSQTSKGTSPAQWAGLGGSFAGRIAVGTNSNGLLQAFVRGTDNTLWTNSQNSSGGWNGWEGLGGYFTTDPIVARNADGRLEVFVVAGNNTLWTITQSAANSSTWGGWADLGGSIVGDPAVGLNVTGTLEVFARGTDNALWHVWQNSAGSSAWSNWLSLGGVLASNPAVTNDTNGAIDCFVLGSDDSLWHIAQSIPGAAWGGWAGLGGTLASDPVVTLDQNGAIEVFGRGNDNALWRIAQTTPGGSWTSFTSLGNSITGMPAVALNANGDLEVFAVGSNAALLHIWQLTPGGSWSNWASAGGGLMGQPGAGRNANGDLTAFAQGTDSALYYITQTTPGNWD